MLLDYCPLATIIPLGATMPTSPRTLNRQQSRRLDQRAMGEYGIPGLVLMENAGRGVAERLALLGITAPVAICCGKGNNAGDGFVIARHLDLRGYAVRVLLCGDPAEFAATRRSTSALSNGRSCRSMASARGTTRPAGRRLWPELRGSSTPCWAPARRASPVRRWTR